jgi:hypothetical protein
MKMNEERKREKTMSSWQTSDIYLASFIIASERSNLRNIVDGTNGKKTFIFDPEPPKEFIMSFYAGGELVNALKLFEAFQRLKSAIYVFNSTEKRGNAN